MTEHFVADDMKIRRPGRILLYLALISLLLFAAWGVGVSVASGETETATARDFYMQIEGHDVYILEMEYVPYAPFQMGEEVASP